MKRLMLLVLCLLVSGAAWAGDPVPGMLDQFKQATTHFSEVMVRQGGLLLASLAGLQFTYNGVKHLATKGNDDLLPLLGSWIMQLVNVSIFFTIITKSPVWFPYILDQWHGIGAAGAGTGPLDPGAIMSMGIDLIESIRAAVAAKAGASFADMMRSFAIALQLIALQLFILAAFLVLAGQLALAMIKGYLWLCVGPLLLGFSGLNSTRDIAMNTLKAAISIGVTILTCYVIAGIAKAAVPMWNEQIAAFTLDNWGPMWSMVAMAVFLALAAWNVPKVANDFINGTVSGGVGEVMATGAAAVGAAAGLASVATGGIGGLIKGANSAAGAASSLASVASQAGNAMLPAGGGGVSSAIPSPQPSAGGGTPKASNGGGGPRGDASGVAISSGADAPKSNDKGPSIAERIQAAKQYIPPGGDDTVAVNAQLIAGGHHEQ